MESERILRPVFREFTLARRGFEERRLRTESTPLGKFAELMKPYWGVASLSLAVIGCPRHPVHQPKWKPTDFIGLLRPQNIS